MLRKLSGKILYGSKTDRGLCRNVNQDAIWGAVRDSMGLFVLSDGMGGHSQGELASSAIVSVFQNYWAQISSMRVLPEAPVMEEQIQQLLLQANADVYHRYNQGQICGATVAVLLIYGDHYRVFWVGDSRIYTVYFGGKQQITVDDIWDLDPETVRRYSEAEIRQSANNGMLTQAIGTNRTVNIHTLSGGIKPGQVFLLCSDGLYKFCEEKSIYRIMKAFKSEKCIPDVLQQLTDIVFSNGAGDNISIMLIKIL